MFTKPIEHDTTQTDSMISVIKKLLAGSFVILFVGICAFLCLLLLMQVI